jgi:XTP/dITP diphosphohydrolase
MLASANRHKARELERALPGWSVELMNGIAFPEETGATFAENARAKAELGRAHAPGAWVAGEDSGLEVEALGGAPGVRSARYAGEHASDADNVAKLLAELEGVEGGGRRARYVCALVCLAPDGDEIAARGELPGRIALEARGSGGFGYDPVFVPLGPGTDGRTLAELSFDEKATLSHRGRAFRALATHLAAVQG